MSFGLKPETIARIRDILAEHGEVDEAIVYGSRAKGTSKPGSDIDISLKGQAIDLHVLNKISHEFDELPIPYTIDVSNYNRIDNPELLSHIDRVGKLLYKRQEKDSAISDSDSKRGINYEDRI